MRKANIYEVIEAKPVKAYIVECVFSDFRRAKIDLRKYIGRGIFKPLLDTKKFKALKVDAELGTIVWPNGADIAPETLYKNAFG